MSSMPDDLRQQLGAAFAAGGPQYDELRPGYPDAAVQWLVGSTPAGARVADIGAGTGKLTAQLVDRGFDVVAVDPSEDMLDQLRRRLPSVQIHVGRGESTSLAPGSVDLATFAQSWHWVDVAAGTAELHRIIRPGGAVAMVWNFLDVRVDWVAELAAIWHTLATRESIDATRHVPALGEGFPPVQTTTVDWEHTTSINALAALVTTRSYYLTAAADQQQQIRDRVTAFVQDRFAGQATVGLPYRTHCYRVCRGT